MEIILTIASAVFAAHWTTRAVKYFFPQWFEAVEEPEEKPKRKREDFTLGDDGELMESLNSDSLTLDDLIRDYDRSEDE
jgi:hypothetical protein